MLKPYTTFKINLLLHNGENQKKHMFNCLVKRQEGGPRKPVTLGLLNPLPVS